jgi:quercetin dioxygenase-like cupin family protein
MHVAPAELRSARSGRLQLRFAQLGDGAFVVAHVPDAGTAGTPLEHACSRPHWGVIVAGTIEVEIGTKRDRIEAGTAFHLPSGLEHRLFSSGRATIAGFESLEAGADIDGLIRARGYALEPRSTAPEAAIALPAPVVPPPPGTVDARGVSMGERIFTRAHFGPGGGYATGFCDLPHWGMVTAGSLVIEWEDDVEVVGAGEVYHCPAGPPGHHFLAADAASLVDFTPSTVVTPNVRLQGWRPLVPRTVERRKKPRPLTSVATAPIV